MYASIDEDIKFRKEVWNIHFPPDKRQRIVMHDNANVSLRELSDAAQHESTRSEYHKECCAKGGVADQPCSWNRGLYLVTGACPDSLYIKLVKILEQQQKFQNYYVDSNGVIQKIFNVFNKGYQLTIEAAELD